MFRSYDEMRSARPGRPGAFLICVIMVFVIAAVAGGQQVSAAKLDNFAIVPAAEISEPAFVLKSVLVFDPAKKQTLAASTGPKKFPHLTVMT